MNNDGNTPAMELSDTPLDFNEGIDALAGMLAPESQEDGQAGYDVEEIESDESTEEDIDTEAQDEEFEEEEETEAVSQDEETVELSDEDYDFLVGIKEWAGENQFTDLDQLKSGQMMRSDYTQKTQAHAQEVQEFQTTSQARLQELGQALEVAKAMVYGQEVSFDPVEMAALKQSDPYAYDEKARAYMEWQTNKAEVDKQIEAATVEYQRQVVETNQANINQQAALLAELVPEAVTDAKGVESKIEEYWDSIGGDPQTLGGITGALELKVLYDAANNANVQQEVAKAKVKQPKKAKRYVKSGSPKTKQQKQKASKKASVEGITKSNNSQEQRQFGADAIMNMLNNGEL